mmetsp:Transcript_10053/g.15064  ORF Transcript_10053/g.15064 Transcript_10053/m.15064 type:complete len:358 (-) Transcript_10053:200-1273(-)|eukprot:CAMPEP_0116020776 /NCGR_PEP_ID=MMETSP0321-20121206/9998_1 /TAXON_ID=163516 /ORGANISM="Leptocylindrus danicus var. danicus, Strain B650" /LENGTH=357 /DNA_ID=CAMNT_0003491531 /DNA_START=250 /DNA_END=1323 /DNA_ORIENTATION=+
MNLNNPFRPLSTKTKSAVSAIEDIITKDEGGRGMASLVVRGDLEEAAMIFARLKRNDNIRPHVLILSGFPCCVDHNPPTETDGPPGAVAIACAAVLMGYKATIVTDECNEEVFTAACADRESLGGLMLKCFPSEDKMSSNDYADLNSLADDCDLVIACERAGPGKDGKCYTMRGIDMTSAGLIAPLHLIVDRIRVARTNASTTDSSRIMIPFLAIGDGGNELGMGKMLDAILSNPMISNAKQIAAVGIADHLIAASVSNWGAYALVGAAACIRINDISKDLPSSSRSGLVVEACQFLPSSAAEQALLESCVAVGCRDGVSGLMEATVDGMPLETSLACLEAIRVEVEAVGFEAAANK